MWYTFSGCSAFPSKTPLARLRWAIRFDRSVWSIETGVRVRVAPETLADPLRQAGVNFWNKYRIWGVVWFRRQPKPDRHVTLSQRDRLVEDDARREYAEAFTQYSAE